MEIICRLSKARICQGSRISRMLEAKTSSLFSGSWLCQPSIFADLHASIAAVKALRFPLVSSASHFECVKVEVSSSNSWRTLASNIFQHLSTSPPNSWGRPGWYWQVEGNYYTASLRKQHGMNQTVKRKALPALPSNEVTCVHWCALLQAVMVALYAITSATSFSWRWPNTSSVESWQADHAPEVKSLIETCSPVQTWLNHHQKMFDTSRLPACPNPNMSKPSMA